MLQVAVHLLCLPRSVRGFTRHEGCQRAKGSARGKRAPPGTSGGPFPSLPSLRQLCAFCSSTNRAKKIDTFVRTNWQKGLDKYGKRVYNKAKNANEGKEMKLTENKTKRLEIRLTEEDHKLLKVCAYTIGQTPSSMVRMFIDTTLNAMKLKIKQGEIKLEDYEAIFNDKL